MGVVVFRQENGGAEVHRMAPEFCERRALDFDDFDPLSFFGWSELRKNGTVKFTFGDDFVHADVNVKTVGGIEVHFLNVAVGIAGRKGGQFADPIEMGPDVVAVSAMKFGINIKEGFDVIIAGGKVAEAFQRITGRVGVDDGILIGLEVSDVFAEKWRRAFGQELDAKLGLIGCGNDDKQAAGDGLGINRSGKRDAELKRSLRVNGRRGAAKQREQRERGPKPAHAANGNML
jgi:hypothetical protein